MLHGGNVLIEKALVYGTTSHGLLVFDEPDFPEVPIQVPGGTVEAGEQVIDAARREFGEEPGCWAERGSGSWETAICPSSETGSFTTFIAHTFICRLKKISPMGGAILRLRHRVEARLFYFGSSGSTSHRHGHASILAPEKCSTDCRP